MTTRYLINAVVVVAFAGIVFFSSCKDTGTELTDIPSSNVSYSQHIQPLFYKYCTSSKCHDDGTMAGGLSLTTWASTTASYLVVAPGLPANSKLYIVVSGQSATPMPPLGYPALNSNQVTGIKTWIKEGAKNN
jgi:hypothetical protein